MSSVAVQQRRLLLWCCGPGIEGRTAAFMYHPIIQTLRRGANATLNRDVWSIEEQVGSPTTREAREVLESLTCGDIFVWIGRHQLHAFARKDARPELPADSKLITHRMRRRGVRTILYQTEPIGPATPKDVMAWSPSFCSDETSPFVEIWDYSHANIKRYWKYCPVSVTRPIVRYVPPGNVHEVAVQRADVIDNCVVNGTGMVGQMNRLTPDRVQYVRMLESQAIQSLNASQGAFAVTATNGRNDYDALGRWLRQYCVQLNVHRFAKYPNSAFEPFRASTTVSAGSLLVSQQSDVDDQREYAGIVHFADTPQAHGAEVARLVTLPDEERRALARARAKLFDEKFAPERIFANASIRNILNDEMPAYCTGMPHATSGDASSSQSVAEPTRTMQQPKAVMQQPAAVTQQPNAILLTGELRFKNPSHVARFKAECRGAELFIVTYTEYEPLAQELLEYEAPQRLHLLSRSNLPRLYQPIFQWRHLDTALRLWGQRLSTAPIVLRHRTDISSKLAAPWAQLRIPAGAEEDGPAVFASTDRTFYAKGKTFVRIFSDMYNETMHTYAPRMPTTDEGLEYDRVINETVAALGDRSGCVIPGWPLRTWHHASEIVAWHQAVQQSAAQTSRAAVFRSERAFAYHVMVRHHARCMRLCLGVDSCATAPIAAAPRYYDVLDPPFMGKSEILSYRVRCAQANCIE